MAARGEAPQRGPVRREHAIEGHAVHAFITNGEHQTAADGPRVAPRLLRLEHRALLRDLGEHGAVALVGIGGG